MQGPIAGGTGLIRVTDGAVLGIANRFLGSATAWILGILAVVVYAAVLVVDDRSTLRQGLTAQSNASLFGKIGAAAVLVLGLVAITNSDRGLPLLAVILAAFVVGWSVIAERTRFGRHVYAVGGNAEAARRAGIDVDRIKITCFMIGAVMAAVGGLVVASRLRSADNAIPVSNLLLNSIAAAVIGGCSLFGGRGRVVNALQGALVIGAVESGMGLLGWPSDRKFMVTGAILLDLTVIVRTILSDAGVVIGSRLIDRCFCVTRVIKLDDAGDIARADSRPENAVDVLIDRGIEPTGAALLDRGVITRRIETLSDVGIGRT